MICLIRSELKKVWGRKSFPGLMALLIFLNLFFLWYLNRLSRESLLFQLTGLYAGTSPE